jgi:hypothetical protein
MVHPGGLATVMVTYRDTSLTRNLYTLHINQWMSWQSHSWFAGSRAMGGQRVAVGDQMFIQRLIFLGQCLSLGDPLKLWSVAPSEMGRFINRPPVCLLELLGLVGVNVGK